jgi:Prp8 binding protein
VLAVALNADATQAISGGIDNTVTVWDLRARSSLYTLAGHTDSITGLALSPDGSYLLSNGMDNTVRMWDVRPYAPQRLVRAFEGAQNNFEKNLLRVRFRILYLCCSAVCLPWNPKKATLLTPGRRTWQYQVAWTPDGKHVGAGSADRNVYVWNAATAKLDYLLPGHKVRRPSFPLYLRANASNFCAVAHRVLSTRLRSIPPSQ